MKNLFTTLCLLINTWMFAQTQEIEWTKNYGGSGMEFTYGSTLIQQTTDGGYIFAAGSDSSDNDVTGNHGDTDIWVVKLNETGEIEWQRSYGGSDYEEPRSIQQTTDGGYVFAGMSYSSDGDVSQNQGIGDYWIVKLDETGTIEWEKSYGGSAQDIADVIHQTTDGGYIVAGNSTSTDGDVAGNETEFLTGNWIIKLDGAGEIEGQQFHARGDMLTNRLYDFILTSDGGYMAVGMVFYLDPNTWQPNIDFLMLKLNEVGEVEWEQTWGGLDYDSADAVQETTDGGYIISGYSSSANIFPHHGEVDAVVLKLNSEGGIEWYKNYGGEFYETFNAIEQTPDGGYMCFGWSDSTDGDVGENFGTGDYWVVRLDSEGEIIWEKSFGGSEHDASFGGFVPTSDGGYILIGETESNDGHVPGNYGERDVWIVKLSAENMGISDTDNYNINLYPNPTTGIINLQTPKPIQSVSIYNLMGQKVPFNSLNQENTSIDISNLSSGTYFIEVILNDKTIKRHKVIKK